MRPKASGECPETTRLRQEFEQHKRELAGFTSAQFEEADFKIVQQFTSGQRDPPENRFAENQTQRDLKKGIQEMEELREFAYELR